MNVDTLLLNMNAIVCALIAARLMFYQKKGRFRFVMSVLAYCVILAAAWTAFRIWYRQYTQIDIGEFAMNLFFCVAIWRARGNIAQFAGTESNE